MCTFGILSNNFRIFHRPVNLETDFVTIIIIVKVVLHNFIRNKDGYKFRDTMAIMRLQDTDLELGPMIYAGANEIGKKLSDYFTTDTGALKWQMS